MRKGPYEQEEKGGNGAVLNSSKCTGSDFGTGRERNGRSVTGKKFCQGFGLYFWESGGQRERG